MKIPRNLLVHGALGALLLLTLPGCGGKSSSGTRSTGTQIPEQTLDAAAQQAASVALSSGTLGLARGLVAGQFGPRPGSHRPRPAAAGGVDSDSVSYSYTAHVYGLEGQELDWNTATAEQISHVTIAWEFYSRSSSDSLSYLMHWTDTFDFSGFSSSQSRWVVSGTGTWLWDWDQIFEAYHWIWHVLGEHTINTVAFEKSGTPTYPVAGSITQHLNLAWNDTWGSQHDTGNVTVDAVLTFNGTRTAALVVDGVHYVVDLETGVATRVRT